MQDGIFGQILTIAGNPLSGRIDGPAFVRYNILNEMEWLHRQPLEEI